MVQNGVPFFSASDFKAKWMFYSVAQAMTL